METRYPNSKNKNSEEEGNQFQDFVVDLLFDMGIVIQNYTSRKYQYEKGENKQGIEIKLDNWCSKSKRLSIEIAERTCIENSFVESGIYRKDNSFLYIQGNFDIVFIFQKSLLQLLHKSGRYEEKEEETIKAFYLPFTDAEKYAAKVVKINKNR
ncbi:MAG TPA: hypothetical protein PLH43_11970 [Acetivibrio sp.]|uniref:hypothetical protein n=1 Tax=Acetivibrio sp. TaxID=1872092 RepID=UPI002B7593E0|nr:hypothetical protein [Acetivibrio sp.]HOM03522.1 hypothetical protein [Acetivibrio sp.]